MAAAKSARSSDRRQALLQAAAEVFFEQGYEATSINAIIERVGGSKRNIYEEFGNKEGLFSAIVAQSADKVLSSLAVEEIEGRDLQETLTAFAQHLMDVFMSPAMIGIYRIAITEANRFPDVAQSFYEQGPGRAARRLAEVLEDARGRGEIRVEDSESAARHFVGMIRDNLHLQVVLGLRSAPSARQRSAAVGSAVAIFLDGVRHGRRQPKTRK